MNYLPMYFGEYAVMKATGTLRKHDTLQMQMLSPWLCIASAIHKNKPEKNITF